MTGPEHYRKAAEILNNVQRLAEAAAPSGLAVSLEATALTALAHAVLATAPEPADTVPAAERKYLIWSNRRGMWWRSGASGYTSVINEAGRYGAGRAERIVADATLNGELRYTHTDQVTGAEYVMYDEVAIPAPELPS